MKNRLREILLCSAIIVVIALIVCVVKFHNGYDARKNMQEASTKTLVEAIAGVPNYENTESFTFAQTLPPTLVPTNAPTDAPTDAPTVIPTQPPTQVPTQAPVSNEIPSYVYSLSSTLKTCGYQIDKVKRDQYNRPDVVEGVHAAYGDKYNAVFIGPEEKVIYLTFTMGYEYVDENGVPNTDKILAILEEKGIKATFFVDWGYIYLQKAMCKKIVESGNALGAHSYRHPPEGVASWPVADQVNDAKKIKKALYDATGVVPTLYRPDSGIWSEQSLAIIKEMGFKSILYSYSYNDFLVDNQPDPAVALQGLKDNLHYGEILYLHSISTTNVKILPEFIDYAHSQGYTFKLFE